MIAESITTPPTGAPGTRTAKLWSIYRDARCEFQHACRTPGLGIFAERWERRATLARNLLVFRGDWARF